MTNLSLNSDFNFSQFNSTSSLFFFTWFFNIFIFDKYSSNVDLILSWNWNSSLNANIKDSFIILLVSLFDKVFWIFANRIYFFFSSVISEFDGDKKEFTFILFLFLSRFLEF